MSCWTGSALLCLGAVKDAREVVRQRDRLLEEIEGSRASRRRDPCSGPWARLRAAASTWRVGRRHRCQSRGEFRPFPGCGPDLDPVAVGRL